MHACIAFMKYTPTVKRIIVINKLLKAKQKKKKIYTISLNLLNLKFCKCSIFLIIFRYYSYANSMNLTKLQFRRSLLSCTKLASRLNFPFC